MTISEVQIKINALREELETRHKHGIFKIAKADGQPVPVKDLQNELYSLLYKKSKLLSQND
jgi:hypothetical protein